METSATSCCVRLQHNENRVRAVNAVIGISTALSIILLIGSVLAFLSLKGYSLGPLNKIPHYLNATQIYGVFAGSGAYLGLNLFFIVAMVKCHKKHTQQNESSQSKLSLNVNADILVTDKNVLESAAKKRPASTRVLPGTYVTYRFSHANAEYVAATVGTSSSDPEFYVFEKKNENSLAALGQENPNYFNLAMPLSLNQMNVDQNVDQQKVIDQLKTHVAKGQFLEYETTISIQRKLSSVTIVFLNKEGTTEVYYCFTPVSLEQLKNDKVGLVDAEAAIVQRVIERVEFAIPTDKDALSFEVRGIAGQTIFGICYNDKGQLKHQKFFFKADQEATLKFYRNVKELDEFGSYSLEISRHLIGMTRGKHLNVDLENLTPLEYIVYNKATPVTEFSEIFPLVVKRGDADIIYLAFKNEVSRENYKQKNLGNCFNGVGRQLKQIEQFKLIQDDATQKCCITFRCGNPAYVMILRFDPSQKEPETKCMLLKDNVGREQYCQGFEKLTAAWQQTPWDDKSVDEFKRALSQSSLMKPLKTQGQYVSGFNTLPYMPVYWVATLDESNKPQFVFFKTENQKKDYINQHLSKHSSVGNNNN